MLKKIMIASLAAGALALNAPVASAEHAPFDCGFDTVAQETATGGQDTFTGAAYGYIVSPTPGEAVSIRCYVRVDGTEADSTPVASGTQAAAAQGQVTYTASDTQDVDLCAEWTAGSEGGTVCFETTTTQIPPQEVIDLIVLLTSIPDPLICPVFASLSPGVPGVIDIDAEGDIALAGGDFWDCPPYGS